MLDNQADARALIHDKLFPAFKAERDRLNKIDRWYRHDHDKPYIPNQATREFRQLQSRSQTPILGLVVTAVAQALYVDGYRGSADDKNAAAWRWWQANGFDRHQIALHRAALAYGLAYGIALPGEDPLTGEPMPVMRGVSPRNMIAFYLDPARDDWPAFALEAHPAKIDGDKGWDAKLYDDLRLWRFQIDAGGDKVTYVEYSEHDTGVPPVVRYANMLDLEGRADGEVEPFIPIAARLDQTTFDRLVVQRFGAWIVRTISGMAPPEKLDGETEEQWRQRTKLALRIEDFLVADDPDTKFGSLPATPVDGFIASSEFELKLLSVVTQTPAHELLGQLINLSAEALAAARATFSAKVEERRTSFGESHEQFLRLAAHQMGDDAGARDVSSQVRWRDTEIRSLAQAADALGKLAQMLGVPPEMLWEKIPGFTQQDIDRAKLLAEKEGGVMKLLQELAGGQTSPPAG